MHRRLPRRQIRLLAALVAWALGATGCDESDPATSQHCVMVRMKVVELQFWREQIRKGGYSTAEADLQIGRLQAQNFQCFK